MDVYIILTGIILFYSHWYISYTFRFIKWGIIKIIHKPFWNCWIFWFTDCNNMGLLQRSKISFERIKAITDNVKKEWEMRLILIIGLVFLLIVLVVVKITSFFPGVEVINSTFPPNKPQHQVFLNNSITEQEPPQQLTQEFVEEMFVNLTKNVSINQCETIEICEEQCEPETQCYNITLGVDVTKCFNISNGTSYDNYSIKTTCINVTEYMINETCINISIINRYNDCSFEPYCVNYTDCR